MQTKSCKYNQSLWHPVYKTPVHVEIKTVCTAYVLDVFELTTTIQVFLVVSIRHVEWVYIPIKQFANIHVINIIITTDSMECKMKRHKSVISLLRSTGYLVWTVDVQR